MFAIKQAIAAGESFRAHAFDGYGGSGSGLFDEAGHLVAMQSASLDMNRRQSFDIEGHYGSALMIEGELR